MRNSDGILVTEIFWFSVVNMLTFSSSPFVLLNIRNKIQNHIELNYSPKYFEKKKQNILPLEQLYSLKSRGN